MSRPPVGDPSALVVLVEEELVVIDLQTEGWPVIQTPYLVPLHCSAITCSHHVSAIPLKLWERILAAGDLQQTHYSKKVSATSFREELDSKTLDRCVGWTWSEGCFQWLVFLCCIMILPIFVNENILLPFSSNSVCVIHRKVRRFNGSS